MTKTECKWPECARATKCDTCGKRLCSPESHQTHRIEGHFVWGDKIECMQCHDERPRG